MLSVGIDIGTYSVKCAELELGARTPQLKALHEYPLSQDPTQDKNIEILNALQQIVGAYDPENTKFVVGVRQDDVSLRHRAFPFKERHKILRSLPFELEDDIPFSQEEAIFEAKILKYTGSQAEILAIACPKPRISAVLQSARDAHFEPEIVSVEGLALSNLFEPWHEGPVEAPAPPSTDEEEESSEEQPPGNAHIVLHIGHETTLVLAHQDGQLVTVRNIDWGGRVIAEAIASKYNLHYVEALKELRKKSFILTNSENATRDQITFSDLIKGCIDELIHELRLTLLEIKTEFNLQIEGIDMVGGASRIKNLPAYLTQKLEEKVNHLQQTPYFPGFNPQADEGHQTVFGVAVGLGLEGAKKPKNPAVNLLKNEFARQGKAFKQFWEKWAYTVKVAAAAFVLLFIYSFIREDFTRSLADEAHFLMSNQAKAVANLSATQATIPNVEEFLDKQARKEKTKELARKVQSIPSALSVLKELSKSVPEKRKLEINVKKFRVRGTTVEIQGELLNEQGMSRLKQALQELSTSGNLQSFDPDIQTQQGRTAFAFRFPVERERDG